MTAWAKQHAVSADDMAALAQAYRHGSHELAVMAKDRHGRSANRDAHATLESLAVRGLLQRWGTLRRDDGLFYLYKLTLQGQRVLHPELAA